MNEQLRISSEELRRRYAQGEREFQDLAFDERAKLSHARLPGVDLRRSFLRRSDLGGADLAGANLGECKLDGADLEAAVLAGACLDGADLRQADLRAADLTGATLAGAILGGANAAFARVFGTNLTDASLDGVRWDSCTLDAATLKRSSWNAAQLEAYLQGGGQLIRPGELAPDLLRVYVVALIQGTQKTTVPAGAPADFSVRPVLGGIHEAFERYNQQLERAWTSDPYDTTIFLAMPFRDDAKYRLLVKELKKACKTRGFKAIRVDDDDRNFSDTLWDNLIINMLSCKYAIAIHVSDHVVDMKEERLRQFTNPNVALEFGFFKSRGQDVLIIKDKKSDLPSDLAPMLWKEFDIENPDRAVRTAVDSWVKQLKPDEK